MYSNTARSDKDKYVKVLADNKDKVPIKSLV